MKWGFNFNETPHQKQYVQESEQMNANNWHDCDNGVHWNGDEDISFVQVKFCHMINFQVLTLPNSNYYFKNPYMENIYPSFFEVIK